MIEVLLPPRRRPCFRLEKSFRPKAKSEISDSDLRFHRENDPAVIVSLKSKKMKSNFFGQLLTVPKMMAGLYTNVH